MPEGYTHGRTARKAAATIHYKPQCPAAFAAGANGPDTLFCYEVWKKAAKRRYNLPELGERMHEERTGAFLQSLLHHVHTRAQVEYVLGFLCHYATDSVVHPYVYALCKDGMPYAGPGGHGYLEIGLDSTLHAEDTGVSWIPADDACPVPVGQDLAEITTLLHTCLLEVFGEDIPVEYLADSFHHTHLVRSLFPSRHGVRKLLFRLIEPLFGGKGYILSHVSPCALRNNLPEEWTDPFTGETRQGGLFVLLKAAEQRSAQYMKAALDTWMGRMDWAELEALLGTVSYTEGIATEASALPARTAQAEPQPQ